MQEIVLCVVSLYKYYDRFIESHKPLDICPSAASSFQVAISADALRMRVRRLCERKSGGKIKVPAEIHEDFVNGGSDREVLELALLQAIQKYGTDRKHYKKVRVAHLCMYM